ncbi:MAG TPA: uracil-DNA glycosylase [Thermoanaerobacterales bacterium]|nr:uracil-DNA glycosylase [Thermoanaerobacterales bacterium]
MALTIEELKQVFDGTEEHLKYDIKVSFELESFINKYNYKYHLNLQEQEKKELLNKMKDEFLSKKIKEKISNCKNCGLMNLETHTQKVPGEGNTFSPIMLIGEAPGRDEDLMGKPFIGRAGQLLDRILNKLEVDREKIYVTNIIKCRPPNNRNPMEKEIKACKEIIDMEISIIDPKVIITLGSPALNFIKNGGRIIRDRGKWLTYQDGILVMPTFHPSYILRQRGKAEYKVKWQVWDDFLKAFTKARELAPDYSFK